MFPEGLGRPRAAPKVGAPAPLINALVVNTKSAIDELWRVRGYVPLSPDEIKARLGYRLDREEAKGYVLTNALHLPLLAPIEARYIGRRVDNSLAKKAALGKQLAEHKKRGTDATALLHAKATLSLAPPPRKSTSTAAAPESTLDTPPAPPPEPPPTPPPPHQPSTATPPPLQLPPPSEPSDIDRHAEWLNARCVKARFEVAAATEAAEMFELIDSDTEEEEREFRELDFKLALMKLKRAVPELDFRPEEVMTGAYAQCALTFACRCGSGRLPAFPWVPSMCKHDETYCSCTDAVGDVIAWRLNVIEGGHAFYTQPAPRAKPRPMPTHRVVVARPDQCHEW